MERRDRDMAREMEREMTPLEPSERGRRVRSASRGGRERELVDGPPPDRDRRFGEGVGSRSGAGAGSRRRQPEMHEVPGRPPPPEIQRRRAQRNDFTGGILGGAPPPEEVDMGFPPAEGLARQEWDSYARRTPLDACPGPSNSRRTGQPPSPSLRRQERNETPFVTALNSPASTLEEEEERSVGFVEVDPITGVRTRDV
ncbi:hypothetical protein AJ80_02251 [Polytolypa hystricis UAMH7299]|uniref:Uncharacterized protein n=1 Tax=Polytolypa hystricis (strain UAMH7299) TaxID=1447883 RepID=A0A2B7YQQ0_POLH7|nr:hypothetical protein AJ80_02251 [Polytolypa hystricis UAMH7299]